MASICTHRRNRPRFCTHFHDNQDKNNPERIFVIPSNFVHLQLSLVPVPVAVAVAVARDERLMRFIDAAYDHCAIAFFCHPETVAY